MCIHHPKLSKLLTAKLHHKNNLEYWTHLKQYFKVLNKLQTTLEYCTKKYNRGPIGLDPKT